MVKEDADWNLGLVGVFVFSVVRKRFDWVPCTSWKMAVLQRQYIG